MIQNVAVFLTPMTPPITSMLGSDRAGPARSGTGVPPIFGGIKNVLDPVKRDFGNSLSISCENTARLSLIEMVLE